MNHNRRAAPRGGLPVARREIMKQNDAALDGLAGMMAMADAAQSGAVLDLALGDPDLDTGARVVRAAMQDALHGYTHYGPAAGDAQLVAAICQSWQEDYGLALAPEQVMVTASGCHAMWLLLSALLAPGEEVVLFAPYFSPYPQQVRLAGGVPVEVATLPQQGFVPQAEALAAACGPNTRAVILNTPNNPTGVCLTAEQLAPLCEVCREKGIVLIADDIYTAYCFDTPFVPAAGMPGMAGHVATVHSFSKDYCMSGWRLGYVAAPAPLVQKMREINESNVYVAPMVSQRAGLHALALRREIFAHVNETYRARAEYVARRVADIPFLAQPKQQGGLYAFLDIRKTGDTSAAFAQKLLARHGAAVIPGTAFGAAGEGFVRMALRADIPKLEALFNSVSHDEEWLCAAAGRA